MAGVRNRTIALLIVGLVLSAGCSPQAKPAPPAAQLGTDPPEEATPTPTAVPTESEAPDPYAIPENPEDIDKAYVERVLEALTKPIASATRVVVRRNAVTKEAEEILSTTHRGQALAGITAAYRKALRSAPASELFSAKATPIEIRVDEVVGTGADCIFALVTQDTSGLAGKDIRPFPAYYQLGTKRTGDDPQGLNPTPWMIVVDAEPPTGGRKYKDPCD